MSSLFDDDLSPSAASATTTGFQAADDKTLRLASPLLTEDDLAALVRYQEAFLSHAEQPSVGHDSLAAAHPLGMEASGLTDAQRLERGIALLRHFCGQRWTLRRLEARLDELEQQPGPEASERVSKAREELVRLRDTEPLARRYGREAVDLLLSHEASLVALHVRLSRVLGQP